MQTTILGILTIIGAVTSAATQFIKTGGFDISFLLPAITAGIGLIKAQDQNK